MKKGKIREINFDLNSKICPSNAYRKIKNFMKNNGFSHRLWSGYISKQPMTNTEVASLNEKLWAALPWLKECANVIDCTTAENRFDLIQLHREQTARMFSDNPYMEICQLEGKIKERIMKNNDNDTEVANNTIKELQAEIDSLHALYENEKGKNARLHNKNEEMWDKINHCIELLPEKMKNDFKREWNDYRKEINIEVENTFRR